MTVGFTGADLANLLNESALLAARRHRSVISMDEVEESMERVIAGPQRKGRVMTEAERTTIAYHESGHALVGHILEHSDPVHKISIVSRGQALGYTLQLPQEDHFLKTKNEMLDELAVSWAVALPRSSCATTSRRARATIWSARLRWRARWSRAWA